MTKEQITTLFNQAISQKRAAALLGVDKFTIANYKRKQPSLGTQLEFLLEHKLIQIVKV